MRIVNRGNGAGGTAKAASAAGVRHGLRSRRGAVALSLAAGAATAMAVPATAFAATAAGFHPGHGSPVIGHVYVNDNTARVNTIAGFDRHANGSLTPEPGSPFVAGGAGTGAGLASQGSLQIAPGGRFLLATDAGSNQVSVLQIRRDGSLRLVRHGVTASGGSLPVSIAVHRDLVYVANAGSSGTNFTGFRLNRSGHLYPVLGSTVTVPSDSQPGDVLFNRTGTKLVGTLVGTSRIASFTVRGSGRLTAAPGSPFTAQGLGPFGSEFRPTNPSQLFVSNAHNVGAGTGTVSAFSDSRRGVLTSIGSSPFADRQTAPCWVQISHDGRFVFAVNTGSGTISRYAITPGGTLTLLGSTTIRGTGGLGAVDAGLSPGGRFLYVDESAGKAVGAFAVRGGSLTELPSSPTALPAGATAAGMAVS
jgi:6-phosphogluconolactonase (cycloisomerase 2 family)